MCDKRRGLRNIASEVGISFGEVQSILTGILGMSKDFQNLNSLVIYNLNKIVGSNNFSVQFIKIISY